MERGKRFFVLSTLIIGACGLAVPCGAAATATAENSGEKSGPYDSAMFGKVYVARKKAIGSRPRVGTILSHNLGEATGIGIKRL